MTNIPNLSPSEDRLLSAVIDATRKGKAPGKFVIRREGYAFHLDLDGYSQTLQDASEKADFESCLKSLCSRGLLRRTEAGSGASAQWEYALHGAALEASRGEK
jgi:hypothetical protein